MEYQVFKVGRGVNAPKKRYQKCKTCGRIIDDFRIEFISDDEKTFSCIHCPIAAHHHLLTRGGIKYKIVRWLVSDVLKMGGYTHGEL